MRHESFRSCSVGCWVQIVALFRYHCSLSLQVKLKADSHLQSPPSFSSTSSPNGNGVTGGCLMGLSTVLCPQLALFEDFCSKQNLGVALSVFHKLHISLLMHCFHSEFQLWLFTCVYVFGVCHRILSRPKKHAPVKCSRQPPSNSNGKGVAIRDVRIPHPPSPNI